MCQYYVKNMFIRYFSTVLLVSLINANIGRFVNDSSAQYKPQNMVTITKKYLFKSLSDSSVPHGYESSDLKNMYLSRQALNSRLKAPILTQEHMLLFKSSQ